jgi:predicted ArsR family transcriptional regulator
VSDLAARTRITRQAARAHLERLTGGGLVQHITARDGVSRPVQIWSLTKKGHGRFPDIHAQMTVELIEAVRGAMFNFIDIQIWRYLSGQEVSRL